MSSRYTDSTHNGSVNLNDLRPTSAASSVRSQDSGVAQSDPKTSIDCSAKSESSPKVSLHNNHYLTNNNLSTMGGPHRLSSSNSHQHLFTSQQQQQSFNTNTEQLREKLQPFNTQRLKTLRQSTKSFIVSSIL
jgi:hypothetical protein